MSKDSTEYGYAYHTDAGWEVTVEIKVRHSENVTIFAAELDEAANDAVEYVRVRAVDEHYDED